jgi:hypothetical protein
VGDDAGEGCEWVARVGCDVDAGDRRDGLQAAELPRPAGRARERGEGARDHLGRSARLRKKRLESAQASDKTTLVGSLPNFSEARSSTSEVLRPGRARAWSPARPAPSIVRDRQRLAGCQHAGHFTFRDE